MTTKHDPDPAPVESTGTPASDMPAPPSDASRHPPEPRVEEEEMGGEQPCQLHRFWDVEE